jgi:hypothetical protein
MTLGSARFEDFWLDALGLPREALRKSTINRYSRKPEETEEHASVWHVQGRSQ